MTEKEIIKVKNLVKKLGNFIAVDDISFKIEKSDFWFYGISSKRYVLYELLNNKSVIKEFKLHGLGHLLNPYNSEINWQKQIWQDILDLHYGNIEENEIIERYSSLYAISKLTVSTPQIYKRFKKYNFNKSFSKQIKPFNFILIGQGTDKNIKPISSFSKNNQEAVHKNFIDYNSGRIMRGIEYWKSLKDIIFEYIDHPESKFENGDKSGSMKRRFIYTNKIIFIGKETKNLENQALDTPKPQEYVNEEELKKKILATTPKEARERGVSRPTLWKIKKKIKDSRKISWKSHSTKRLI